MNKTKAWLRSLYYKEAFYPSYLIGIWINPAFINRRGLLKGVRKILDNFQGGKLLDVGCGSKPYEVMVAVDEYIGIDIEVSGHCHTTSKVDKFYDGKNIPFPDSEFDYVFSSQVFEHVFNIDELLNEINRVLKKDGKLGFTCPFVWEEHEPPFDFWRYTSFSIEKILDRHGFELIQCYKSTGYFETVMQLLSTYVSQHMLPRNKYLNAMLHPIFVAPINIIGILLGTVLPKSNNLYFDNIVIAKKR